MFFFFVFFFRKKCSLKINQSEKTPGHRPSMGVGGSGSWVPAAIKNSNAKQSKVYELAKGNTKGNEVGYKGIHDLCVSIAK